MSAKIMFDENVPIKVVEALKATASLLAPTVRIEYMPRFMRQYQIRDSDWLPKVVSEQWTVISADRGKRRAGGKLPKICESLGITHVLLGPSVHELRQMSKMAMVLLVWDELVDAATSDRGLRYRFVRVGNTPRLERA